LDRLENAIRILLEESGDDDDRPGLLETPARAAKAWAEYMVGYSIEPADLLKCFEDGAENYDQMVLVKDIPFYSTCEHHLAPFFGTATVAYIPNGRVVGLSKINRLVDAFARRLQVQERLTGQIADALGEHLKPVGVGVIVKARHLCIEARGVGQQGHHTVTSALRGALLNDPSARAEFFNLAS
jgi:GTP cyclohydrolase IA